jgi:molecular chaperone HtpG
LREGEDEFLSAWKLKSVIRTYSDHISLPIKMQKEEDEEKKEQVLTDELETVNQASALWARKSDITPEQYDEFYKHISHDFGSPLTHTHNRVEGRSDYTIAVHSARARSICGIATSAAVSSCTSNACSSWTTPSN